VRFLRGQPVLGATGLSSPSQLHNTTCIANLLTSLAVAVEVFSPDHRRTSASMMQAAVPEQNDVVQEDEMLVDEENDVITYQSMQPFNLVVSVLTLVPTSTF
jgi:hypothetical protein